MFLVLFFQILSGLFLSFNFCSGREYSFFSVAVLSRESFFGGLLRWFHLNGASLFFLLVFMHLFRGLFFCSYRLLKPWIRGVSLLLLLITAGFIGYVLV